MKKVKIKSAIPTNLFSVILFFLYIDIAFIIEIILITKRIILKSINKINFE